METSCQNALRTSSPSEKWLDFEDSLHFNLSKGKKKSDGTCDKKNTKTKFLPPVYTYIIAIQGGG